MASTTATETKLFAKIRREVVIHRMTTSDCLEARLFWAIILWSWCYPDPYDYAVIKGEDGRVRTDLKGNPIPAKLKDLRELLGLAPGMKGDITKAAARLEQQGAIRFGEKISGFKDAKILYPIHAPTKPISDSDVLSRLGVPATDSGQGYPKSVWHIGKITVTKDTLPSDPVAGTRAIEFLDRAAKAWCTELRELRYRHHQLLVQGAAELGILIDKNLRSLRRDPPQPLAVTCTSEPSQESPPPKADEEDGLYKQFKNEYPKDHFDEPRAKPAFKALPATERNRALARLRNPYLQCARWQDQDGRWIPFASTFLRNQYFDTDPPPLMHPARPGPHKELRPVEEVLEYMKRQRESNAS